MKTGIPRPGELLGLVSGVLLAPLFALGSAARRARLFHPRGSCYLARAEPVAVDPVRAGAAARLSGDMLVRLSGGWWKHGLEWPDVLGLALRFLKPDATGARAGDGDLDLILGTFRRLWTLPAAFFLTRSDDYLANTYHGAAPFELEGVGKVWIRAVPRPVPLSGAGRDARLARALEEGLEVVFSLEVRKAGREADWHPLVSIRLLEVAAVDEDALGFNPGRAGRGVRPRGFIQYVRPPVYFLSQRLRPHRSAGRASPASSPGPA